MDEREYKNFNEREYILFQTLNRALFICEENMRGPMPRGAEDLIEATFRLRAIRKLILDMYLELGELEAGKMIEELKADADQDEDDASEEPGQTNERIMQN